MKEYTKPVVEEIIFASEAINLDMGGSDESIQIPTDPGQFS